MVPLEEPLVALRVWCRLVRAHRAAAAGGRVAEARALQGRVEQAKARYRLVAGSATAHHAPAEVVAKALRAVAPLRVARSAGGFGPHRDSWPVTGYAEVVGRGLPARR